MRENQVKCRFDACKCFIDRIIIQQTPCDKSCAFDDQDNHSGNLPADSSIDDAAVVPNVFVIDISDQLRSVVVS